MAPHGKMVYIHRMMNAKVREKPKAVLFDLGSTLLRGSIPDIEGRCRYLLALAENSAEVDEAEFVETAVSLDQYAWNIRSESPFEFTTRAFIRILTDEYSLRFLLSPDEIERRLYFHGDDSVPTDGVCDLLKVLHEQGIRMAVISNHLYRAAVLSEHLECHDMRRYFEFVVSSADYGIKKPNPKIFQAALRRMSLKPQDAWYAGDSYAFDVAGAVAAGLTPVWYRPFGQPIKVPIMDPSGEQTDAGFGDSEIPDDVIVIDAWYELRNIIGI